MNHFTPLVKGQTEWHIKYNQDFEALYSQLARQNGLLEQVTAENEALRKELAGKASKEPPAMHDIPLLDGFHPYPDRGTGSNAYYKDEFGIVHVHGDVVINDGFWGVGSTTIGALPEGYRPDKATMFPALLTDGNAHNSQMYLGYAYVNGLGELRCTVLNGQSNVRISVFQLYYPAIN